MNAKKLFEEELARRGLNFTIDPESGRHSISIGLEKSLVCIENLQRDLSRDRDVNRVSRFLDSIIASVPGSQGVYQPEQLFWALEPNDYVEKAEFRIPVSDRVDRVLVYLDEREQLIHWVNQFMLNSMGISETEASERGVENLAIRLNAARIEYQEIEGVRLGFLATDLPFKTALILAPNLREVVASTLGWPLLAVAPVRDFLYLWDIKHEGFVKRVGRVVVDNYLRASYPISTEVFKITEEGIETIGGFPTGNQG